MKTSEQINKIEAVVLYILQHFKEGVDYIKLFKIMYFAQREYLASYGLTIIDDTFKARHLGPVPTLTYKVIKLAENHEKSKDLKDFISAITVDKNQMIYANQKPNMDYIAEMAKIEIDKTISKYKEVDSKELSSISHDSAYDAVCDRMKDDPQKDVLTQIDIARAGGATKEMIERIREIQLIQEALECA